MPSAPPAQRTPEPPSSEPRKPFSLVGGIVVGLLALLVVNTWRSASAVRSVIDSQDRTGVTTPTQGYASPPQRDLARLRLLATDQNSFSPDDARRTLSEAGLPSDALATLDRYEAQAPGVGCYRLAARAALGQEYSGELAYMDVAFQGEDPQRRRPIDLDQAIATASHILP